MTRKLTLLLTVLIVLFGFIGCPDDTNDKDIEVTLSSVTANGSATENTTTITLTFDKKITGLSANDITLSGVTGVTKGTLSNTGATYTLPINGFNAGGTLSVAVSKTGYNISGSSKTITIFYTPTSPAMDVYNSDKESPYIGQDLDFYIQGDTSKTLAATIRSGKLVIRYIPLPEGLSTATFYEATEGLERIYIQLISFDDTKKIGYMHKTSPLQGISIAFYNKDGNFFINSVNFSVKQGWNFTQGGIGSSTNPADSIFSDYLWVIGDN